MLETLKEWDKAALVFLNNLGSTSYDSFWLFVTRIESWTALFIFFALLLFYFYKRKKGLLTFGFAVLSFGVTYFLTHLTKVGFERLRPNNVPEMETVLRVLQDPSSFSFFSGHASSGFAIATFVVLALRSYTKWIYMAYLWPLFFAFSRIYVGVHYPSDILIGALVGTIMAVVFWNICKKLLYRLS